MAYKKRPFIWNHSEASQPNKKKVGKGYMSLFPDDTDLGNQKAPCLPKVVFFMCQWGNPKRT